MSVHLFLLIDIWLQVDNRVMIIGMLRVRQMNSSDVVVGCWYIVCVYLETGEGCS